MQKLIYRSETGQEIALSNSRPFILESLENISNSGAIINTSRSAGQDGITIDTVAIKEKLLPLTGGIVASDLKDLDLKRAMLSSIFNPKYSGELIYTNNSLTRKIKCSVQDITFQKNVGLMQRFLIQFLCPNPFWMDIYTRKEEIALWIGDFEFPLQIPIDEGIEMGHRQSNLIVNISNVGDVECGMKIQFRALATVVNPSLFNVNSRQYIKVNRTLKAGELLEITTEFANKRIEMVKENGLKENVYHWIDVDSEFLQLDRGDNLFRYDAESGIDNLEVAIYHSPLYLGV